MTQRIRIEMSRPLVPDDRSLAVEKALSPLEVDRAGLARLMLEAYRGTVDDEGETLDDAIGVIDALMAGEFGDVDPDASVVYGDSAHPIAATLVTHHRGRPLLAFSMTHPGSQRRGLARRGPRHGIGSLARRGHREIVLVVTSGNHGAIDLYRSEGFVPTA